MTDRKRPVGDDPLAEIARGLEGLMGQFGAALGEAMSRLGEGEGSASHHSRVFDTGKGPVRAEIGLRVRGLGQDLPGTGFRTRPARAARPDAEAMAEAASPAAPAGPDPARDVVLTGYPDRGGWTLAADLPGVGPEDVAIDLQDGALHLTTRGARPYRGRAELPPGIDTARMTVTVRNGVLAVMFPGVEGGAE
jgi:HSP20 family molecular chaperone IbpA